MVRLTTGYTEDMVRKSQREYFDALNGRFEADKANDFEGYVNFEDILTDHYGPEGSPRRERFERNSQRRMKADTLAWKVTRHLGPVGSFWRSMLYSSPGSLHAAADSMSFDFLGDFLWHDGPVTEDYYQSWVSKVHLPRWLHYHVGPRRDCTHV